MKLSRKTLALLACIALIATAAFFWSFHKKRLAAQKLADEIETYRVQAERGDAKAQFKLGSIYYYGTGVPQDFVEAFHWYQKAAEQGDAEAQRAVGFMYSEGRGVPQDNAQALRWTRLAAEQGHANAEAALGSFYFYGRAVPQDYAKAARWYRKSAEQDYPWAQEALGSRYYYGEGVPKDYAEAARWYRKAADQGYTKAQYDLGSMYYYGQGVTQDRDEANRWFRKAADQGDERARRVLGLAGTRASRGKRLRSLFLWIVFLAGAWFSLDFLLRKNNRNTAKRSAAILSVRNALCWLFAIISVVCAWIAISDFWSTIHGHPAAPLFRRLIIPVVCSILTSIFGIAWWSAWQGKPWARGWGIAASAISTAVPLWNIYFLGAVRHSSVVTLAVGFAGLVAFSRKVEQGDSAERRPEPLRIPGDGTNNVLNKIAEVLLVALSLGAYFWWIGWIRAKGLSQNVHSWQQDVWVLLIVLVITTLHELGHTIAGLALGMKLRVFASGPFQWRIEEGKWRFRVNLGAILLGGGATAVVPASTDFPRGREVLMVAAGPVVSLFTGTLALLIAFTARSNLPRGEDGLLALFGIWSVILGLTNLLPFRAGESYSDGAQIYQLTSGGPWADYHEVIGVVTSSLVTPLRPRDFPIEAIQRAAHSFTQGKQGLLLRLFAYTYFFDSGRLREAREALAEAESIYHQSASDIPAQLLTVFVFGNAYLGRDAAAAREWWARMEAKKPIRFNCDYWRAYSALQWVEGNLKEAHEAWEKSHALAQQLPHAGEYEFDRYCCAKLREAIDEVAVSG